MPDETQQPDSFLGKLGIQFNEPEFVKKFTKPGSTSEFLKPLDIEKRAGETVQKIQQTAKQLRDAPDITKTIGEPLGKGAKAISDKFTATKTYLGSKYSDLTQAMGPVKRDVANYFATGISDKPTGQQLRETVAADRYYKFEGSDRFKDLNSRQKIAAEKMIFEKKLVPMFQAEGRKPPTWEQWAQFRASDDFKKYHNNIFEYFDLKDTPKEIALDVLHRGVKSFSEKAEGLFIHELMSGKRERAVGMEHTVLNNWDAVNKFLDKKIAQYTPLHPNPLVVPMMNIPYDKDVSIQTPKVTLPFSARGAAEKGAEYLPDLAMYAALHGPVSRTVGGVSKAGVTGALAPFEWAQGLSKTFIGRRVLGRIYAAADGAIAATAVQQHMPGTPEFGKDIETAIESPGRFIGGGKAIRAAEEGVVSGIKQLFKKSEDTGATIAKEALKPEAEKAVKDFQASVIVTAGPKAAVAGVQAAAADKTLGGVIRDAFTQRMTHTNGAILDGISRNLYGRDFTNLSKDKSKIVMDTAVQQILDTLKNPLAHSPAAASFVLENNIHESAKQFPQYAEAYAKFAEAAKVEGRNVVRQSAEALHEKASNATPDGKVAAIKSVQTGKTKVNRNGQPQAVATTGMGPGAANKEEMDMTAALAKAAQEETQVHFEDDLHSLVYGWGLLAKNPNADPVAKKQFFDAIVSMRPGTTEQSLIHAVRRLDTHLSRLEVTGGENVFRSSEIWPKNPNTIWQEQLAEEAKEYGHIPERRVPIVGEKVRTRKTKAAEAAPTEEAKPQLVTKVEKKQRVKKVAAAPEAAPKEVIEATPVKSKAKVKVPSTPEQLAAKAEARAKHKAATKAGEARVDDILQKLGWVDKK